MLEDIMKYLIKLLIIGLYGLSFLAWGLASDKDQPIDLEADSVDINQATGISVYTGHVIIKQGSIKVEASKVVVYQYANKKRSTKFIATGHPVKFRQKIDEKSAVVTATAKQAEYEIDSENLILIGDAYIHQPGKITMQSDRIDYNRVKATVKAGGSAQGKQRVKMSFTNAPQ